MGTLVKLIAMFVASIFIDLGILTWMKVSPLSIPFSLMLMFNLITFLVVVFAWIKILQKGF